MNTNQLTYFITIADQGSIKRAAAFLHITPSSLSQFLRKLETTLNQPLFVRAKKDGLTLSLTPAGIRYYQYCRELLKLWTETEERLSAFGHKRRETYVIGCNGSYSYLQSLMPVVLQLEKRSNIKLDIALNSSQSLQNRLIMGELDIVFGTLFQPDPALQFELTCRRELDLCVSADHPLARYSYMEPGNENVRIPIYAAKEYPFILLSPDTATGSLANDYFKRQDFHPVSVVSVQRADDMVIMLRFSNSVGFLPIQRSTPGNLRLIALEQPIPYTTGAIYRKGYTPPPALREIIEWERQCHSDMPWHPPAI